MVYARRVQETRAKTKTRDAKRTRSFDGVSSKNRLKIQIKSVQNSQELVVIGCLTLNLRREKTTCGKYGKRHYCEFLQGTNNCFSCGRSCHKVRHGPNLTIHDKGSGQA